MAALVGGGAARSLPLTSRTAKYCGLEHPARLWNDEGSPKDEMAGLPPPSQAIPAACDVAREAVAPFDMLFEGEGDKVQGLARAGDSWTGKEVVGVRASGAEEVSFCA